MRGRIAILAAAVAAAAALALVLVPANGGGTSPSRQHAVPGQPSVDVVSPRNGARQAGRAVVVKVEVENFRLAPLHFGGEPELGEGHIRFALNRVPDCVDPVKLQRALDSPLGRGRLVGASFDFPRYAGPNGVLAERIGSSGSYSPATRPEIYYHGLPAGLYRLVINLAQNNGAATPHHTATNFQILPGHGPPACTGGKVSSAKAEALK
ncbi:MAG: hypothetical protein FVQ78_08285 [Solirubrobacterales bacterium]|nr:hypothetical protein [Solirubrobacterales bacterium]